MSKENYSRCENERRLKWYHMRDQEILNVLNFKINVERFVKEGTHEWFMVVPKLPDLPEDVYFKTITWNNIYACWAILCWSIEYEVIPEGKEIPIIQPAHVDAIRCKKDDKFIWREHPLL